MASGTLNPMDNFEQVDMTSSLNRANNNLKELNFYWFLSN